MDKLRYKAYGKINLMLNISGVREDGYHTLETVMQTVSLHDVIEIRFRKSQGIGLKCDLPYIPRDERNIAWKAADLFSKRVDFKKGIDIDIKKTIPVGGGMGGGSANAAAVLNMLNKMTGYPLDSGELAELGLKLGADVPFCLNRGTYLAEGIGEKLTKLPDMPRCSIVVCKPRTSVSSKNAYGVYDEYNNKESFDAGAMIEAIKLGSVEGVAAALGNSFEGPISAMHPEIGRLVSKMKDLGALGSAMTGSGSVVFGIFKDNRRSHVAKAALRMSGLRTFCVKPVSE